MHLPNVEGSHPIPATGFPIADDVDRLACGLGRERAGEQFLAKLDVVSAPIVSAPTFGASRNPHRDISVLVGIDLEDLLNAERRPQMLRRSSGSQLRQRVPPKGRRSAQRENRIRALISLCCP